MSINQKAVAEELADLRFAWLDKFQKTIANGDMETCKHLCIGELEVALNQIETIKNILINRTEQLEIH